MLIIPAEISYIFKDFKQIFLNIARGILKKIIAR